MKRSMLSKKAVEWLDEAAKIATNQQCYYGSEEGTGDGTAFSLTGHNAALWARATIPERRAVVDAFASNTVVINVAMVNAYINDELGIGALLTLTLTLTLTKVGHTSLALLTLTLTLTLTKVGARC